MEISACWYSEIQFSSKLWECTSTILSHGNTAATKKRGFDDRAQTCHIRPPTLASCICAGCVQVWGTNTYSQNQLLPCAMHIKFQKPLLLLFVCFFKGLSLTCNKVISGDQPYTGMPIKISMCGDVQSQRVFLIPPVYLICTSGAMRETDSKEILPPGFGFYLSAFYLNMWITISVHAGFHFQDNLHLKFGFMLLRGRNYLQCANVNVECNCPGD